MDKQSNLKEKSPVSQKVLLLVVVAAVVVTGVYLLFGQYNIARVPIVNLTHAERNYTTFFELDEDGNRIELVPVFGKSGYLERLTGSAFLDAAQDFAFDESNNGQRHRIGYSRVLIEHLDHAQLFIYMRGDIQYIILLDNMILYSDFPDPHSALGVDFSYELTPEQYIRGVTQRISIDLPPDHMGMTLTVIEFITPEQAVWWYPAILQMETSESEGFAYIMAFGPGGVIAGCIGAVVVLLTVLFALQLFGGKRSCWLLLLPVLYGILIMIRMAFITSYTGSQFWSLYDPVSLINEIAYFCGGNLLLIFLAFKSNTRLRFILIAAATIHLIAIIWYIIYERINYGFSHLYDVFWLGMIGFVCIILAFVLMIRERKDNRYFKQCIWTIAIFAAVYTLIVLISRFTNYGLFFELTEPMNVFANWTLFPLNNMLYLLILLLVIVFCIDEYIMEMAEQRSRLSAFEMADHMKTEFLENMSHELKTPLTSVSVLGKHSYSVMTEDWQQAGENPNDVHNNVEIIDELRDNLRIIVVESDRMRRVVDGLLDVASIEQNDFIMQKESFSISDLVQEIGGVQFKALNTNKNILKTSYVPNLPKIFADRDRLQEVLLNLLSNATRHTKEGTITISAKQEQGNIILSIADNGEGIPEDLQENLFKRFLGADSGRAHGTGMGLYICKQIIELHDGSIRVESKSGDGTTVYIELPVEGVRQQ